MSAESSASGGLGIGSIIAAIISWVHWHSVGWCILHALLGWIYIVYYVIVYGFR